MYIQGVHKQTSLLLDPVDVNEGRDEARVTAVRVLSYPKQVVLDGDGRDRGGVELGDGQLESEELLGLFVKEYDLLKQDGSCREKLFNRHRQLKQTLRLEAGHFLFVVKTNETNRQKVLAMKRGLTTQKGGGALRRSKAAS